MQVREVSWEGLAKKVKDWKRNQSLVMALCTQGHKEDYVSMYCWFLFGSALPITCLLTRRTIFHACAIIDQRPNMDISCKFMPLALELSAGITAMERMYRKKDICLSSSTNSWDFSS